MTIEHTRAQNTTKGVDNQVRVRSRRSRRRRTRSSRRGCRVEGKKEVERQREREDRRGKEANKIKTIALYSFMPFLRLTLSLPLLTL